LPLIFSIEILTGFGFNHFNFTLQTHQEKPLSERAEREPAAVVINEVQLILAKKRTSLAAMRTGIAVFALPLSAVSVLIATS
jgi:hypothetical protein